MTPQACFAETQAAVTLVNQKCAIIICTHMVMALGRKTLKPNSPQVLAPPQACDFNQTQMAVMLGDRLCHNHVMIDPQGHDMRN